MELSHGFTTREEWKSYFSFYFDQIRHIEGFVNFSMNKDADQWIEEFKQKAVLLENEYQNQQVYLQRHIYYFTRHHDCWSEEVADSLLSYLFRYCTSFEDIHVAYETAVSLENYYTSLNNEIAIMKCELVIATCYLFLDVFHLKDKVIECCHRGIAIYERYYDRLSQEEKSLGLSFFDFLSVMMGEYINVKPIFGSDFLLEEFQNRITMLHRFMKEADMSLDINQILPYFENCWTSNIIGMPIRYAGDVHEMFTRQQLCYLKTLSEVMCERSKKGEVADSQYVKFQILDQMLSYYLGIADVEKAYEHLVELEKLLSHKRMTCKEEYDDEVLDCFNLLIRSFVDLSKEDIRYQDKVFDVFDHLMDVYTHFPSSDYLEHIVDGFILTYVIPILAYLNKEDALIALLKLTIFRQPQTVFHTVMVSECAKIVTSYMIELKPELLIGLLDCGNVDEVKEKRTELLEYVKDAALLHDVGKIICTNVINMQYRKLIDLEFEVIKFHPSTSGKILEHIPSLKEFSDVAVGHHKSYDGSFGYPMDFDNTKSDKKILIDLITVCDTLDAATDYLGRSYARTKELDEVIEEMKAQADVRYAKSIVDLIDGCLPLQKELSELLRHTREQKCKNVYEYIKNSR